MDATHCGLVFSLLVESEGGGGKPELYLTCHETFSLCVNCPLLKGRGQFLWSADPTTSLLDLYSPGRPLSGMD